jgi:hypothetical protein
MTFQIMHMPLLGAIGSHLGAPLLALLITFIVAVVIWDGVWKLIAMWKSARNGQRAWYICLAIFNTAGILPILYLLLFQKKPAAGS